MLPNVADAIGRLGDDGVPKLQYGEGKGKEKTVAPPAPDGASYSRF